MTSSSFDEFADELVTTAEAMRGLQHLADRPPDSFEATLVLLQARDALLALADRSAAAADLINDHIPTEYREGDHP